MPAPALTGGRFGGAGGGGWGGVGGQIHEAVGSTTLSFGFRVWFFLQFRVWSVFDIKSTCLLNENA